MDVDHAGGASDGAAAQRPGRAREAQGRGGRRRRRHARADARGRRDRGDVGVVTTILITGFGPFPGAPTNPTTALARRLARLRRPGLGNVRLVGHVFTTSYAAVDRELPQLIAKHKPDALLSPGRRRRASRRASAVVGLVGAPGNGPKPVMRMVVDLSKRARLCDRDFAAALVRPQDAAERDDQD